MATLNNSSEAASFLNDTGEISQLIKDFDWSKTCIGDIDAWSTGLKINLSNVLHSGFPMFLFWGDDFLCFYNEAFKPSLGADGKHPAIGKKAIVLWGDIWHIIGPMIQQVMVTRKAVMHQDLLVPFFRNGKVEDIYWTFCYSPAFDENNDVKGVLVTCMETTDSVLLKKSMEAGKELSV